MNRPTLHALRVVYAAPWQVLGLVLLVALVVGTIGARERARWIVVETVHDVRTHLSAADVEIHFQATVPDELQGAHDVDGVVAAEPRLVARGVLRRDEAHTIPVLVRRLPDSGAPAVDALELHGGRLPAPGESAVVIDRTLARFNDLDVGDRVSLRVRDTVLSLPVVGVSLSPDHLVAPVHPDHVLPVRGAVGAVSVSAAAVRDVEGAERVNVLGVRLEPGAEAVAVAEAIAERCGLLVHRIQTWDERPGPRYVELLLGSFDAASPAILGVLALTGILAVSLTLGRIVRRQRRAIGVLLALGHPQRRLAFSFVGAASGIALAGALLGIAVHLPMARVLAQGITADIGFPPLVDVPAPWPLLIGTTAACLGLAALAAWRPAQRLARRAPARALAPTAWDLTPTQGTGLRRAAARLNRVLRVPAALALGFAQALRRPRVTATAALGLALAFGTLLAYLMLQTGHRHACLGTVAHWSRDVTVTFDAPVGAETLDRLAVSPEALVEPYISRHGFLRTGKKSFSTRVLGLEVTGLAAGLPIADGRRMEPGQAGDALIDRWLASHRGLFVGDEVELVPYANAPESQTLRIVGILEGIGFGRVVVALSTLRALYAMPDMATGAFVAAPGSSDALEAALAGIPSVEGVFPRARMLTEVDAASGGRAGVIRLAIVLGLLYAMLFLMIMAALDADDRAPQLALLQAMGWRDRALLLLLGGESGVRGTLGLLVGMGIAPLLASWFAVRIERATGVQLAPSADAGLFVAMAASALLGFALATLPAWIAALRTKPGAMAVGLYQR